MIGGACLIRRAGGAAPTPPPAFEIPSTLTPGNQNGTFASQASNAIAFSAGDAVFVAAHWQRNTLDRSLVSMQGDWDSPVIPIPIANWVRVIDTNTAGAGAGLLASAASSETSVTATAVWSGSVYDPVVGAIPIPSGAVVRQTAIASKAETGTTLNATFGAATLAGSLLFAIGTQQDEGAFTGPSGWSELYNLADPSISANNIRVGLWAHIGATSTSYGISALDAETALVLVELIRP